MGHKRAKLSDQIRRAINACGLSRYAICQAADIDQSLMSRFMNGKSQLSLNALDRLGKVLDLRIVAGGSTRPGGSRRARRRGRPQAR